MTDKRTEKSPPLFRQARDVMAARIRTRVWPPGMFIPGEGQIAKELLLNAESVRRALTLLESEKLIRRTNGGGVLVCEHNEAAPKLTRFRAPDGTELPVSSTRILESNLGRAREPEMRALGLEPGSEVVRVVRLRSVGTSPIMLDESTYPIRHFNGLNGCAETPYHNSGVAQIRGHKIGEIREFVSSDVAGLEVASKLCLAQGQPLLKVERIFVSETSIPLEWWVAACDTRQYQYVTGILERNSL